MLLNNRKAAGVDLQIRSIAHCVKYRGRSFRSGVHDYDIVKGGLRVYLRLVAPEPRVVTWRAQLQSRLDKLDALRGGGLEEGTSTLISGPPSTGKFLLASQVAFAAAKCGEKGALFLFEEAANNLLNRSDGLGTNIREPYDSGLLIIRQIDPAELSPGAFSSVVCAAADAGAKDVVLDSINGYLNAMLDERFLTAHLHELLTHLSQRGVVTILIGVRRGMLGGAMSTAMDARHFAYIGVLLRDFEYDGEVKQVASVFKKRGSTHEKTIRQFSMSEKGIRAGEVLRMLRGVLTGEPIHIGNGPAVDTDAEVR